MIIQFIDTYICVTTPEVVTATFIHIYFLYQNKPLLPDAEHQNPNIFFYTAIGYNPPKGYTILLKYI